MQRVPDRLLVVGSAVSSYDSLVASWHAHEHSVSYTLEAARGVDGSRYEHASVVDVSSQNPEIERQAWEWVTDLTDFLTKRQDQVAADLLRLLRRRLYSSYLKPIAVARARAQVVWSLHPSVQHVSVLGATELEELALAERFGDTRVRLPASSAMQPEPSRRRPIPGSVARRFAKGIRARFGNLSTAVRESRQRRRSLATISSSIAGFPAGGRAIVVLNHDSHLSLLRSTLEELRSRGWVLVLALPLRSVSLSPDSVSYFDGVVYISDLVRSHAAPHEILHAQTRETLERLVHEWAAAAGLGAYAEVVLGALLAHVPATILRMEAQELAIHALEPACVLSVNETAHMVEEVAAVAGALGIPTVNVQHGVISETHLRSDFRFDAFCVFGEAYAEALAELGTAAERIKVVGNPYLDASSGEQSTGVENPAGESGERREEVDAFKILFAAQHRNFNLSDFLLHSVLSVVLEYAESDRGCQVLIKLHPHGEGKELGYELALEEHPGAHATVVREGDLHRMIRESDCVVTYSSTVGFEAVSLRVPVIIANPVTDSSRNALVAEGVGCVARDALEFGRCVEAIRRGQAVTEEQVREFDCRYAFRRDGLSGVRIADVCEELAAR
jgi:hypothetical protein